jgi:hypothetical protein
MSGCSRKYEETMNRCDGNSDRERSQIESPALSLE